VHWEVLPSERLSSSRWTQHAENQEVAKTLGEKNVWKDLEDAFAQRQVPMRTDSAVASTQSLAEPIKELSVLDAKRGYNLGT
jgi:hypothetical protein